MEDNAVLSAIKRGLNVIIDATNLNPKTKEKWEKIAKDNKCNLEYKEFYISFKEALERDSKRERSVGEKVLKRFYTQYYSDKYYAETAEVDNRIIRQQDRTLPICVIVDCDGTLCIHNGRNPYDLSKVSEDKPNTPLCDLIYCLYKAGVKIIFFSGREGTKQCAGDTIAWIKKHVYDIDFDIYMRKEKDYRPDEIIKEELYNKYIDGKYYCAAIFDDRNKVVAQWRQMGLLCNQVYYGDF